MADAKNENARDTKTEVKEQPKPKSIIFVSPAEKLQIANFRPERYVDGRTYMEQSITFSGNMYATDDPEKIAYIRTSNAMKSGMVFEMESQELANRWIGAQLAAKKVTSITTTDISEAETVEV